VACIKGTAGNRLRQMHLPGVDIYFDDSLCVRVTMQRQPPVIQSDGARVAVDSPRLADLPQSDIGGSKLQFYPIATLQHYTAEIYGPDVAITTQGEHA
jgi:hypothetical protein